MSKRRSWKDLTVEDFQKFYNDNYSGMSRSEVAEVDSSFYSTIKKKRLLNEVFPPNKGHKFTSWQIEDFQKFYQENHLGMSRTEVAKTNRSFYRAIETRRLQDKVFPPNQQHKFVSWQVEDFQEYYQQNHSNRSRSEVQKVDKNFYKAMIRRQILNKVFPKSKRKPKSHWGKIDNVKLELDTIIEELGRFPKAGEIKEINNSLCTVIYKYHGSLTQVKIQLGYADKEMAVLKEILEELGDE